MLCLRLMLAHESRLSNEFRLFFSELWVHNNYRLYSNEFNFRDVRNYEFLSADTAVDLKENHRDASYNGLLARIVSTYLFG